MVVLSNHTERSIPMQATYSPRRSSVGMLTAAMVFLAALIFGGAGGYLIKGATTISVSTAAARPNPVVVSAPVSTQVTTDNSGEARRHFKLAN
jgi:hypothetical protein